MRFHEDCPDLTGEWKSGEYEALSVSAHGAHNELLGLSMALKVTRQHGCHFAAENIWSNAEIGGTEHVAGVLNPMGNWITILEVGEHPAGGSTGRVRGRLVNDHQINWEYAAYAADGSRAIVFSTILARAGTPAVREKCPDVLCLCK